MPKNAIVLLLYHHHKLLDVYRYNCPVRVRKASQNFRQDNHLRVLFRARVPHSTPKFRDSHVEFKGPNDVVPLLALLAISEKRCCDCPQFLSSGPFVSFSVNSVSS
jgi:hypothetical protein